MFHWLKTTARRSAHLVAFAAVCALSLAAVALLPSSSQSNANAMYLLTNDSYVAVDHPSVDVFLTDANAELISHESGNDLLITEGLEVTIVYGDLVLTATSANETVRQLLERLNVHPSPLEMVALAFDENTLNIEIASEFIFYEHVTSVIEHEVTYQYNSDRPDWYEEVIQPGSDGMHTETYEVIYQDTDIRFITT